MGSRFKQLVLRIIAVFIAVIMEPVSVAADSLPKIVAHSDLQFGVYKGDQLTLEVLSDDDQAEIKWITNDEMICRTRTCEIDTNRWSLGVYAVTLVVLNDRGSASLTYRIRVIEPAVGYKPGKVTPRLVSTSPTVESVGAEDLTVRMLEGRGFSYDAQKLHIVGKLPRSLIWQEKLKSQPGSVMIVSRTAVESHVLGSGTVAQLIKSENERRALILHSGVLRSRQLDSQRPRWSILVGDWLQIDGDEFADVVVTKPKADVEAARVVVLRGTARVFQRKSDDSKDVSEDEGEVAAADDQSEETQQESQQDEPQSEPEDNATDAGERKEDGEKGRVDQPDETAVGQAAFAGQTRYLRQGLAMTFKKEDLPPDHAEIPKAWRVAKHIKMSTPFYVRGQRAPEDRLHETLVREKRPTEFKEALALAEEANASLDFIKTIEILAPFAAEIDKSFNGAMALGHAYRGIFLYRDAFYFYKRAAELDPDSADAPFAIGTMYLGDRNWKKAKKYLEIAADHDYPDVQQIEYYLGVAQYRLGDPLGADSHFQYAIWAGGNQDIERSAQEFRHTIAKAGWVDLRLGIDIFLDSNVLRASANSQEALKVRPKGAINKVSSLGYSGAAGFSLWALQTREARLALVFDVSKRAYANSELKDVQLLDQALGLEMGIGFLGKPEDEPLIGTFASVKAQTIYVGKERAIDRLRWHAGFEFPSWYRIKLGFRSDLNLDPLPLRDDIYDPVIQEVAQGERSHRHVSYFLSTKPIEADRYELDVNLVSSAAKYRNDLHAYENFSEFELGLGVGYKPGPRHRFSLDGQSKTRQYEQNQTKRMTDDPADPAVASGEKRKDQNLTFRLGWAMRYTTSLRGDLSIEQEQQSSNRNAYSRQVLNYGVRLDL